MMSTKKNARIAGLLYLITVLSGIISLVYVPSELIVWENAAETYNNIVARETLFKLSVLSDIILYTTFIFLSLVLFKLLRKTNETIAIVMVVLVLISIPISFVNLINKLDVLSIINGTSELHIKYSEIMAHFESHNNGILVVEIFWGLWLFPFGYLIYKSELIPKIMGVFLMLACFGYLADFFGYFFFPDDFGKTVIPMFASITQALGEIGICLWLLIIGVREKTRPD
ncbi:DUF4386 domain-containing protein [Aquimarina sp. 2201CG14-23]|uniref:DUF4386 domain-containing protein n=1 Tax=Aquimarina mycalae TaxID=3040073 RepID=UPI002477EDE3|nr:DUF4386 domain-containing protein [Aquimarina sp. 2201CG14-23]MDH7445984.1 DUF4386 domain-containing protein [Aquimarina sp. 2201CG14-23]